MTTTVVDKMMDDQNRHVVQVDVKMASLLRGTMATAKAEIELPKQ